MSVARYAEAEDKLVTRPRFVPDLVSVFPL
jgi:hypothetical protein